MCIYVLAAKSIDVNHIAAFVGMTCPLKLLQQLIQHLQDFSGQHVSESVQHAGRSFVVTFHILTND